MPQTHPLSDLAYDMQVFALFAAERPTIRVLYGHHLEVEVRLFQTQPTSPVFVCTAPVIDQYGNWLHLFLVETLFGSATLPLPVAACQGGVPDVLSQLFQPDKIWMLPDAEHLRWQGQGRAA